METHRPINQSHSFQESSNPNQTHRYLHHCAEQSALPQESEIHMTIAQDMLTKIEAELQRQVARLDEPRTKNFHEMLAYHLGWTGEGAGPEATGKRIRPLLLLLTCAASNENNEWESALPAAAAVELIHNFSLVHDDIQDNSDKRRGRPTVWKIWGAPMAINVGDALFVIAHQSILDITPTHPPSTVIRAASLLHTACLELTRGQYLDMSYEKRTDLAAEDYWPMVTGKTGALLSACCHIGAALGGANEEQQELYRLFGQHLGLAFQAKDDILGIWGDEALTGKSTASDLVEGKNSLPILAGLGKKGKFAERWAKGKIQPEEVEELSRILAVEDGYAVAYDAVQSMTDLAQRNLQEAEPKGEAGDALFDLLERLLTRQQ